MCKLLSRSSVLFLCIYESYIALPVANLPPLCCYKHVCFIGGYTLIGTDSLFSGIFSRCMNGYDLVIFPKLCYISWPIVLTIL